MSRDFEFLSRLPRPIAEAFSRKWRRAEELLGGKPTPEAVAEMSRLAELLGRDEMPRGEEDLIDRNLSPQVDVSDVELFSSWPDDVRKDARAEILGSLSEEVVGAFHLRELLAPLYHERSTDWESAKATYSDGMLTIQGYQVMADWETPIMHGMVDRVLELSTAKRPKVLEIGWGMGISGSHFLRNDIEYTVIEANAEVAEKARQVTSRHGHAEVVRSLWQDADLPRDHYDVVFFDGYWTTYETPPDLYKRVEEEWANTYLRDVVRHFLPLIASGGLFTFFVRNRPSQVRLLLEAGFSEVICNLIQGFEIPEQIVYYPQATTDWLNIVGRK